MYSGEVGCNRSSDTIEGVQYTLDTFGTSALIWRGIYPSFRGVVVCIGNRKQKSMNSISGHPTFRGPETDCDP